MTDFKQYEQSDAEGCVALWNESIGDSFPMDIRLWTQNVDNSAFLWRAGSYVAKDINDRVIGVIIAKSPCNINCIVVSPSVRRIGLGSSLLELATGLFEREGSTDTKWIIGQDRNHFFPGVPEHESGAIAFFEKRLGYRSFPGTAFDMHRSLGDFEIEPRVQDKIDELAARGISIGPCLSDDIPSLTKHIAANFSPRWSADTAARIAIEGDPAEIIVAKTKDSSVIGFAHTYSTKSKYIGPSIYWRRLMGSKYGGLGPIGVDVEHRKIGLGLALLASAVQHVKDGGATNMVIDWTNLVDFYAKVGFTPWKTYVGMHE